MELKIGNKVKIKDLMFVPSSNYEFGINSEMRMFSNKIVTIWDIVFSPHFKDIIYRIEEDRHKWMWAESMFDSKISNCFVDLNDFL